ncbi:MAG: hypothetical protein KDA22_10705, partial [Phycisphaerales bacterium]|nr:hypothetical protein [Phycisphaerales bacterium]
MRLFPCQLVLVVGVLAVAWAAIGGSIVAQESVRDGAVIAFDPPALELGEVEAGDRLMPTVKVANIVDRPVTVDYVFGSGSTTGSWSPVTPFTFGPGESIEVPFRFLVPPRQGNAFSKRICFRTDDRDHPLAVLTVNGSVPLKIAVEPDQVAACRDDPETGTITLRAVDGQAFRILHANPPIVRDLPTDRRVEHTLHIDWPAWAARGEYPVAVALVTSHPELMKATVLISLDRVLAQAGEESQEGNDRGQAAPLLLAAVRSADLAALASALEAGADVNRMYGRSTR